MNDTVVECNNIIRNVTAFGYYRLSPLLHSHARRKVGKLSVNKNYFVLIYFVTCKTT